MNTVTKKRRITKSALILQLIGLFTLCLKVQSSPILKTLKQYEDAKSQASKLPKRFQSITVVDGVPYVHLAMLIALSQKTDEGRQAIKEGGYQGLAAGLLAMEHLNTGNGTLVEEVWFLNERCDIRFTAEILDTGLSERESLNHAVQVTSRADPTGLPTAFIGGFRSVVSIATSLVTSLRGIPQISPISTSSQLDNIGQFPLFGRTVPSDDGTAVPAILYLRNNLGIRHLAILHANDSYGNAYAAGLQKAALQYAPDMTLEAFSLPVKLTPDELEETMTLLKDTSFRYFFGIFNTAQCRIVMVEAFHQGIAGDGQHNWMFADAVSTSLTREGIDADSPLSQAIQGAIRIAAVGGVPGRDERYDLFLQAMRDLNNPEDIATIQSYHPTYPNEPDFETYTIEDDPEDFFDRITIGLVPFLYDAVIALGLAACNMELNDGNTSTYFDGFQHFQKFTETQFLGASGNNRYHADTGTRLAETARYSLLNFVQTGTSGNKTYFDNVQTSIFQDGEWVSVNDRVFNDGTTNTPPDLPPVEPYNIYIGSALRTVGLILAFAIWGLSIGFAIWMFRFRKSRVIKSSQPIFLGIIALGCFMMGLSIVFLTLDDELLSAETCSAFCIMAPWFFSFGWILSFSALFAKTQRVNKIFQNPKFLRIKVTVKDVMGPMIILQTITNLLMLLWYIFARPTWVREATKWDAFGRQIETRAYCSYVGATGYVIPLGALLLAVLGYTLHQAYHARNVSTEFAETEYIFGALAALLLVSFVGFPIAFIAKDDTRSRFFVLAAIISVISLSLLVLIFVPKMNAHRKKLLRSKRPSSGVLEIVSRRGSRRVKISGLSMKRRSSILQEAPKIEEAVIEEVDSESSTDSEDDKAGVAIIHHPMEVEQLQETVEELQTWNEKLIAQVARLEKLHRKTHDRLTMVILPHESPSFDELSLSLRHPLDESARDPFLDQSIRTSPAAFTRTGIHDSERDHPHGNKSFQDEDVESQDTLVDDKTI